MPAHCTDVRTLVLHQVNEKQSRVLNFVEKYNMREMYAINLENAQTNQCGCNVIPGFYIHFFHRLVAGKSGQSGVTPGSLSRSWFTAEGKTDGL